MQQGWRRALARLCWHGLLVAVAKPVQPTSTLRTLSQSKQEYWRSLAAEGILDGGYLARINCEGGPFDAFRGLYQAHILGERWNVADAKQWVEQPGVWTMIKKAEELLEVWRRKDFNIRPTDELSVDESMTRFKRNPAKNPLAVLDKTAVGDLAADHLNHVANGAEASNVSSFSAVCFPGLIAALVVFGRALAILGLGSPVSDGAEDGFLLWRVEMGYILAGLMWGEGALMLDLTTSPGWPIVGSRFVEQSLTRPLDGSRASMGFGNETLVLGLPRPLLEARPSRMPPAERYHRATDPMGATSWGKAVGTWMVERASTLVGCWTMGKGIPWGRIGHAWVRAPGPEARRKALPESRVRLLGLVSWHGALDLEVPELLRAIFPQSFDAKYVLYGNNTRIICTKTEGSDIVDDLCAGWADGQGPGGEQNMLLRQWDSLRGEWELDPSDPRLYFPGAASLGGGDPAGQRRLPELITSTSFNEAIWVVRHFPSAPLVLFFGPTLLMQAGQDIVAKREAAVADFWEGFWALCDSAVGGRALLAAESLFRSEQFFFQTGIEVPFLRPMSVWVNATYRFQTRSALASSKGQVLVHSRGRLKYETHFVGVLLHMAGPAFPFEISAQEGRILPFGQLAAFRAVVILPWSPEICMLRHLFKMAVPLFVPDRNLLLNMVHISNQRLLPYPYYGSAPGSDRAAMRAIHPYDPFLDTALPPADPRGVAARAYWAEYSEFLLLPCLQHFRSSADLLVGLHGMDSNRISAQMRAAYSQDMEEMASFWTEILARMLKL